MRHKHDTADGVRRNDDLANAPAKRRDDLYLKLSDRVPFVGGSEISVSGRHLAVVVIALAALIVALVLGFIHDSRAESQHKQVFGALIEQATSIDRLAKAVNLNTYVLTLSDQKRQALDLAEPKEIQDLRQLRDLQRRFLTEPESKR